MLRGVVGKLQAPFQLSCLLACFLAWAFGDLGHGAKAYPATARSDKFVRPLPGLRTGLFPSPSLSVFESLTVFRHHLWLSRLKDHSRTRTTSSSHRGPTQKSGNCADATSSKSSRGRMQAHPPLKGPPAGAPLLCRGSNASSHAAKNFVACARCLLGAFVCDTSMAIR